MGDEDGSSCAFGSVSEEPIRGAARRVCGGTGPVSRTVCRPPISSLEPAFGGLALAVYQGGTLVVHERDLIVRLRHKPFAAGGMRHCFRMWDMGALGQSRKLLELVGKRSK